MTDYGHGYDWDVIRTTTDKLQDELNELAWDVYLIQYIGGRDWVIIARDPSAGTPATQQGAPYAGSAKRNKANTLWEITIPSMGPNDEPLTATASRAVDIEPAAKLAIANMIGFDVEDVEVDIDVDMRPG